MVKLGIRRVKSGEEQRLRAWMSELSERRSEVLETFKREGTRHEQAYLVKVSGELILIYAMEAQDHTKAAEAFAKSTLAIDVEHKAIMAQVLGEAVSSELLFDCLAS